MQKKKEGEKIEREESAESSAESAFWTDQIARKILTRKKFFYTDEKVPKFKKFMVKTSASISGVLHIGRLCDTIRGEAVKKSLEDLGAKAELFWVAEDMDPLRKIPEGVPKSYEQYIGMPVSDLPDPDGCHRSYSEHHVSEYMGIIDRFVFSKMEKFSMREEYRKGNFNEYIKLMLENSEKLAEIQNKFRQNKLPATWSPWTPICENCGKIITTKVLKVEDGKVHYKCGDYSFEKYTAKGCGHEGVDDPVKGNGKLMWKSEWAAQWARWNVAAEGAGKEYQVPGSAWWINAEMLEKVLHFPMPEPIFYEYLIINGQKMSASVGNVVYPRQWLEVAKPELLRLLFLKDPMRVRDFRWDVLPNMSDEYEELEKVYYGIKEVKSERDRRNLKRLFEIIQIKPIPKEYKPKVSCKTILEIAKVLPEKNQLEFAVKKLEEMGTVKKPDKEMMEEIEEKLEFAKNLLTRIEPEKKAKPKLSDQEKNVISNLIEVIEKESDGEELQKEIFQLAKNGSVKPAQFFKLVYQILLGSDQGPRLGQYIIDVGKIEIIRKLKTAL